MSSPSNCIFLPHPVRLHPQTRELLGVDPRDEMQGWKPGQSSVWQKGTFSVPGDITEERVQFAGEKYRRKFGAALELQGFQVLGMDGPFYDGSVVAIGITEPDRKRYVMWARARRPVVEFKVDVPDEDIGLYQKAGFNLV